MNDIAAFYTRQSERFGPSGVLPHHEARAQRLKRIAGDPPQHVLELGAGAGGTAAATARLGYAVTSVEFSPLRVRYAREIETPVDIREDSFYTADLGTGYDVVAYWNGFGMGDDTDQRQLLRRVRDEWLSSAGVLLMDVFNPAWWARLDGEPMFHEEYRAWQRTQFDAALSRFVDAWWNDDESEPAIEQSIRCYAPVDLILLLQGTGLTISRFEVDDREGWDGLDAAYSYLAVLKPA